MGGRLLVLFLLAACGEVANTKPDASMPATLTIVRSGNGIGSVTASVGGIDCGSTCMATLSTGTEVTLTATAATDYKFGGWSGGACTGTAPCTFTLTGNTTITAPFDCGGSATIEYTGAIAMYTTVSCATSVTIEAFGASGGDADTTLGGLGARMKGTFALPGGTQLKVLVGGRGVNAANGGDNGGGTGGGGTFVALVNNSALVVAGGGGGASLISNEQAAGSPGLPGVVTADGSAGNDPAAAQGCATGPCYPGGVGGAGGTSSGWTGWHGGAGGGGFTGNGVGLTVGSSSFGTPNGPGQSFMSGGAGGTAGSMGRAGGFGGGGAGGASGGGGGGYSGGGAGGDYKFGGGGGGSFNSGTNPDNTEGVSSGNGKVVITW
jgi:hypothetical protein